ncbi:beta-propeller fold lactonase family protein [Actinoplanes sp. TRM 88003]|uniref:Beta-propeller fold lactonase family protein n=1 Tax=Paractinoplanes aksuensis TaxID=2939490 RepID=A0ABT1DPM6_9ACTN|nr:beta-propeller fold lactonase family protein [Actinoplanes aksuensis]MCO8272780.1 beta-propeller fold lactonase family protein [Actinoplanes aksuensis]
MSETGLPQSVLTEIGSPIRESRLTGVDELARLAWGADLALAAAARHALQQMMEDDSRSVSAAAAAALERTAVRLDPERIDFGPVAAETQRLVADVRVDGPPLAVAGATVNVSGPGLRAMLSGRTLRIMWLPRSDWLDGSVTVRGPAGWADVRVTGQVAAANAPFAPVAPAADYGTSRGAEPAGLRTYDGGMVANGYGTPRVTVLPAPPASGRRQIGTTVLVAILTTLVVLGGAGVAMALLNDGRSGPAPVAALPTQPQPGPGAALGSAQPATPDPRITRVPLAQRVKSVAKPKVIGTVRVGAEPEGVAVAPDGRTVFVANQNSRILSLVDVATRKVTPIALRNTPRFVAVSRDGNTVFVSMYEDDKHTGSGVAVVDTRSRKVLRYLDTGHMPYTLAVAPDNKLWVPIHSDGRLEIFSSGTLRMVGELPVKPNPHAVGFSSDQMRAFTANHESNAVTVIDMRTNKVLQSIPVSRAPHSIAVSPDGRMTLVAGYEADAANLIDTVTLKRTGPFKVGRDPQSVAFSADSRYGYTVNEGDGTISVLNGKTGAVTATVKVGRSPRTIGVSPDGRLAYVSNGGDNTISIVRVGE